MMPLYRFALILLVLIVGANVLLYHWFAAGARETSADVIVQKAYVVSRLLSEAAGYSLANEDGRSLENAVAEAFKDRHIVSVTIIDSSGRVLFENAAEQAQDRLSTFETPVTYGDRNFGKLITSFVRVDENERITSRLSTMATRQLGLIAVMAMLLIILCLRERHVHGKAVAGAVGGELTQQQGAVGSVTVAAENTATFPVLPTATLLPSPRALMSVVGGNSFPCVATTPRSHRILPEFTAAVPVLVQSAPYGAFWRTTAILPSVPAVSPQATVDIIPAPCTDPAGSLPAALRLPPAPETVPASDFFRACKALQKAAEFLASEANHTQLMTGSSRHYVERISAWQQQALQAAQRADLLIVAGRDIVGSIKEQSAAVGEARQGLPTAMQSLQDNLLDSRAIIEQADDLVRGIGLELAVAASNGRTSDPGNSATAAAEMVHEGVSIMQQRVFPAVTAVLDTGNTIATQISSLLLQVEDCGDRSLDLGRCSNEMFDLVDEMRLLRCHPALGSDPVFAGKDGPLDLLSGRLESLATTMKRETQELLGAANEASVIGMRALSHVDTSRSLLERTGAAVEDAAAAVITGGELLERFRSQADVGASGTTVAGELIGLAHELHRIRAAVEGKFALVTVMATQHDRQISEYVHTLEIACETLLQAESFLAASTAETISLASLKSEEALQREADRTVSVDVAIAQLLNEAYACLLQILPRS